MMIINDTLRISLAEFKITFARSGGPGGQNVNKVNSKAILRWSVIDNTSLPLDVRGRFLDKFANRLTGDGEIIITSQKFRDQTANINDCLEKLQHMIATVADRPIERRPTKPTLASKQRRVEGKREQSQKKAQRRSPKTFD